MPGQLAGMGMRVQSEISISFGVDLRGEAV
jgi:hypothetical protein